MGLDYIEACKIAYEYYKEAWGVNGFSEIKDLGSKWLFYPKVETPFFGGGFVTIEKKGGEIDLFKLPSDENFKLLKNAISIDVPCEYK